MSGTSEYLKRIQNEHLREIEVLKESISYLNENLALVKILKRNGHYSTLVNSL